MERFAAVGFPTPRDEDWRFTPVGPIAQSRFGPAAARDGRPRHATRAVPLRPCRVAAPGLRERAVRARRCRDVHRSRRASGSAAWPRRSRGDGAARSAPRATRAVGGSAVRGAEHRLPADGALVHVPAGVGSSTPIHLALRHHRRRRGRRRPPAQPGRGRARRTGLGRRELCHAGRRGAVLHQRRHRGRRRARARGSSTRRIQRESERRFHVGLTAVDQAARQPLPLVLPRTWAARSRGTTCTCALERREHRDAAVRALPRPRRPAGRQPHRASTTTSPTARSWEVYKGVLDDRRRAVFNGKVFVQPGGAEDRRQADQPQPAALATGAKVDTKPQLEIFADDVKCTHGATVGRLDEAALLLPPEPRHLRRGRRTTPHLRLRGRGARGSRARARCAQELERLVLAAARRAG